jgi:hypothetical protein
MNRSGFSMTFATVLAAASLAHAAPSTQPYRTLRSAHIFSFGGVGIAGVRTPEEKAYDVLIRAPDAEQQFRRLLVEATTLEGKMYALHGLRQLRVRDYWDLAMPYRRSHGPVETAFACSVGRADVSEMVVYADHAYAIK